jgi:hypothetical protein
MKMKQKLGEKFNIETEEPKAQVPAVIPPAPVPVVLDDQAMIDADADKARRTISALIDKSIDSLNELIRVAKDSEHPRAYEVVATMIKTTADISKDLLEIQKKKAELRPGDDEPASKTQIGTQQNIFVGSTNDLLRALAATRSGSMEIPANAEIRSASD